MSLQLLADEEVVLKNVRDLELVFALDRRKKLPEGMELCFTRAARTVLDDWRRHHLYHKYTQQLAARYSIDILPEMLASFTDFMRRVSFQVSDEARKAIVKVGFQLFDFVSGAGFFVKAESVILSLME